MNVLMEIILDNRETAVIACMGTAKCSIRPLPIGDFLINGPNEEPFVILERKTYADLVASLKDSRFREQKHRIQNSPAPVKGYIIEGVYPKTALNGIKPATIDSIILGLTLRDKYVIIYSTAPQHTAEILQKIAVKYQEWTTSASVATAHQDALIQGSIVKKDGLTVQTCYLAQLAQIPGVSLVTARAISETWPTMYKFITFIHDNAALETLTNFTINDKRLGQSVAERIITYMREPKVPKRIQIRLKTQDDLGS